MDINISRRLAWTLCLAVLGASARASDYEIEVIVFRHVTPQTEGAWSTNGALPDFGAARRLAEPAAAPGEETPEASFTRLPTTAHRLSGAGKLLSDSSAYEVVNHQAWRQGGDAGIAVYVGDERTESGPATTDADALLPMTVPSPRAEGTLRLQVAMPEMRVQSDFVVLADDVPVRIRATRNLKPGELHYLDHELLGILLQVSELKPPAADADLVNAPDAPQPDAAFSD